jgi:hypothetical protein
MPDWPPQLDLFGGPEERARRHDPDTAKATARRIKVYSEALKVLQAYKIAGRALTDHDAYNLAGYSPKRFSHRRCTDLRQAGLIVRVGTGLSEFRHSAMLCQITAAGMELLLRIQPVGPPG